MRLHRFYIPQEIGDQKTIVVRDTALFHQLKNVFRLTTGGQVIVFDNSGYDYHALISSFERGETTLAIVSKKESENTPAREVHLFSSVIKKDHFEWVLEKCTELGVSHFHPIISDRSEKKNINMERAEKIVVEASEQSGRGIIPVISPIIDFEESLTQDFHCFAFHPSGKIFTINHTQNYSPLGIFIGPEGGWTERELFLFKKNDIGVYSIGPQILRAETASVAISSLILLQ